MSKWRDLSIANGPALYDLFGDGDALFVAGEGGALFRSDDGGARWSPLETTFQGTLFQLAGSGSDDLYAVGYSKHGSILLRSDDGRRFRKLPIGRRQMLRSVAVWGDEVYAVGSREIIKSADRGQSFEVVFQDKNRRLVVTVGDNGFVVGANPV